MYSVDPNNELLIYIKKIRLDADRTAINLRLMNNQRVEGNNLTTKDKLSNLWKNTKSKIARYEQKDNSTNENYRNFNIKYPSIIDNVTAKDRLNELCKDDKYGLIRLLLAISVILDDEYVFKYKDEGLKEASKFIYGNEVELKSIKDLLEKEYRHIHTKDLSSVQKGFLVGSVVLSMAGIVMMPVLLGGGLGASASTTTALLAAKGFGDMQLGIGIITLESIALGAALVGSCYGGMKLYNNEKIKREFRRLSPESHSLNLAVQVVYIDRIKKRLSNEEFKEQLDSILKSMNTLKADLDYYYFVEHENIKNNKEKMEAFHKFDSELSNILNLA